MIRLFLRMNLFVSMIGLAFGAATVSAAPKTAEKMSPAEAVLDMSPGWNLGNALDSIPNEDSWNNKPTRQSTIQAIKKAGFRSIRLPVTWTHHTGPAPDYRIDETWMTRVEEIVDWALEEDLWVFLDVHHDSWEWMQVMTIDPATGKYKNDSATYIPRLEKVWTQIAKRFGKKSAKLVFEILNEPNDGQWEPKDETPANPKSPAVRHDLSFDEMNLINARILKVIRKSGGKNKTRLVMVAGQGNDPEKTLKGFTPIADPRIIMTVHYYAPWDFVSGWWGHYTWGATNETRPVDELFAKLNDAYSSKGLPIVVGEWGAFTRTERFSKWYYYNYHAQLMRKYGWAAVWWDNGADHFDREKRVWRDPVVKDIVVNAGLGVANSFIMTSDIFVNAKAPVADSVWPVELNGNTLVGVYLTVGKSKEKQPLIAGQDYILDGSKLTVKAAFLQKVLDLKKNGVQAVLTFDWSAGADQPVNLTVYDRPLIAKTSVGIDPTQLFVSSDIRIPLQFNGMKIAAVKLVDKAKKEPVKENWTPYLNVGDDFDFNEAENVFLIKGALMGRIKQDSVLTIEFWPKGITQEVELKYLAAGAPRRPVMVVLPFQSEDEFKIVTTKEPVKVGPGTAPDGTKCLEVKIAGIKGWAQDYLDFTELKDRSKEWGKAKELAFRIYIPKTFDMGTFCSLVPIGQSTMNYWMALPAVTLSALPRDQWVDVRIPLDIPDAAVAMPNYFQTKFVFNSGGPIEGSIFIDDFGFGYDK